VGSAQNIIEMLDKNEKKTMDGNLASRGLELLIIPNLDTGGE